MLGYILSKINLLILVTAIFAIVSFFAIGLTDITKVTESKELASRLTEKSFALTSSPSYCLSDSYLLPPELMVAGNEFYYVLAISKRTIGLEDGDEINLLIFSIYPRSEITKNFDTGGEYVPKVIAADSFRTNAELNLYSKDYIDDDYTNASTEKEVIYLDPQAINPGNYLMFIKEIVNGESFLYVIGCGPTKELCEAEKTQVVGEIVHPSSPGTEDGGFKC